MINKEDVKHIAKLSRLGLNSKEISKVQKDLSEILSYFNSLSEIDVSGVEPTFHSTESFLDEKMREEDAIPQDKGVSDKLIEAAPSKEKRHIKVKAIL